MTTKQILDECNVDVNVHGWCYSHRGRIEKAMEQYAQQENEVLKIQLAAEKGISESRLEDMDLLRYEVEVLQQQLEQCKRRNISIIK